MVPGPGCPGLGSAWLRECPGAVGGAGEPEVDEPAEVEGGGAVCEPAVVPVDAAVGDAAAAAGHQPGDGPFDRGPPPAVLVFPGGAGGVAAGGGPRGAARGGAWGPAGLWRGGPPAGG